MENRGLEMALTKTALGWANMASGVADLTKRLPEVAYNTFKAQPLHRQAAIGVLGGFALKNMIERIRNDHNRKVMIEALMEEDPVLKQADPAKLLEYYATICMFAPSVSKDRNVVRELLTNFVRFGRIDFATIEALVKTEENLKKGTGPLDSIGKSVVNVSSAAKAFFEE